MRKGKFPILFIGRMIINIFKKTCKIKYGIHPIMPKDFFHRL